MNNFENQKQESVNRKNTETKERETKINIGDVYFDKGLDSVMEKEEFESEVQNMNLEIEKYLGKNKNEAVHDFRVYSDRKEYENYMETNFPEKPEEYYMDNYMYCIYDEKSNKYFIGKFMTLELDLNDKKVIEHLEKTGMTFDELVTQNNKEYKNNIYPTIAHEMTHAHSFFKGVDNSGVGNKWVQEMICVFIDQKMWEKYVPRYKKMTEDKAREQVRNKNEDYLFVEIVKDFEEGHFEVEDWERFLYEFLEKKYDKEKLKKFWVAISEVEADFESSFEVIFGENLRDVMSIFQEEVLEEKQYKISALNG